MLSPSSNPRLFLQGCGCATRSLAGAGVGASALTSDRQAALVTHAAISSQVDQALDRKLHFATQIAFDGEHVDVFANTLELSVRQVFYFFGVLDARRFGRFGCRGAAVARSRG